MQNFIIIFTYLDEFIFRELLINLNRLVKNSSRNVHEMCKPINMNIYYIYFMYTHIRIYIYICVCVCICIVECMYVCGHYTFIFNIFVQVTKKMKDKC